MIARASAHSACALLAGLALFAAACQERPAEHRVTVFYAASLARVMGELEPQLERELPGLDLRLEPSGSVLAARKVVELGRPADLVITADWRVIRDLLVPEHARFVVQFASNEIVLAYAAHSRYTDEVSADNWPQVLGRADVRLGRADERTAPLGFQTLQVWRLVALSGQPAGAPPDLAERLAAKCHRAQVVPDVAELVGLLEARAIDYAFVFRSVAEEHNLKVIRLPAGVNLGDATRAEAYARVRVPVQMASGQAPRALTAAPVVYGLTIPDASPEPAMAARVAAALLGPEGQRLLRRSGFSPIRPARAIGTGLPASLAGLVEAGAK